jgi:hypothetical protein
MQATIVSSDNSTTKLLSRTTSQPITTQMGSLVSPLLLVSLLQVSSPECNGQLHIQFLLGYPELHGDPISSSSDSSSSSSTTPVGAIAGGVVGGVILLFLFCGFFLFLFCRRRKGAARLSEQLTQHTWNGSHFTVAATKHITHSRRTIRIPPNISSAILSLLSPWHARRSFNNEPPVAPCRFTNFRWTCYAFIPSVTLCPSHITPHQRRSRRYYPIPHHAVIKPAKYFTQRKERPSYP